MTPRLHVLPIACAIVATLMTDCGAPQFVPNPSTRAFSKASDEQSVPTERVLHFFAGRPDGAIALTGRLAFDAAGNLYGATNTGGSGTCSFRGTVTGCGAVFELTPTGSGWSERILYSFKNVGDGAGPWGTLTLDPTGNVYGVTMAGGNRGCVPLFWVYRGCGTVFELMQQRHRWVKRTLHVFSGGADGGNPAGGLARDSKGNLYGTAFCGGAAYSCYSEGSGEGVFFQLKRVANSNWSLHVLHAFERKHLGGDNPLGDLTVDRAGNIYGMANNVYEMTRIAGRWRYNQLILLGNNSFSQGRLPSGGPAFDAAGNIYGTMEIEGDPQCNCGLVFEVSHSPSGTYKETVLYTFTGKNGASPRAGLTVDANGNVYGTTSDGGDLSCNNGGGCGIAFSLQPGRSGFSEKTIHTFEDDAADGGMPSSSLLIDGQGDLYGTTEYGGQGSSLGLGSVFEITTTRLKPRG